MATQIRRSSGGELFAGLAEIMALIRLARGMLVAASEANGDARLDEAIAYLDRAGR